jgi:hypothetical protein
VGVVDVSQYPVSSFLSLEQCGTMCHEVVNGASLCAAWTVVVPVSVWMTATTALLQQCRVTLEFHLQI